MPKNNSNIPTAILSFVNKRKCTDSNGGRHEEDAALLLPHSGSSFNLTGDSEYLLSKSTSYQSNANDSARSSRSSASSRGGSGGHRRRRSGGGSERRYRRGGSGGSGGHKGSSDGGGGGKANKRRKSSPPKHQRHELESSRTSSKESSAASASSTQSDGNPPGVLSPIAGSIHSGGNSSSSMTIHSGKSWRSSRDRSGRSRKSSPSSRVRGKLRREERRREWIRRWRRRRLMGKMLLTSIYCVLFAFTLLVTLGPLVLHFGDPTDWCPFFWDMDNFHKHDASDYSLNIDQLQQSFGQRQQEVGSEPQKRRSLTFERDSPLTADAEDLKGIEIDLLRKTSKDVHSSANGGSHKNDRNGNDGSEQPDSVESTTTKEYENPDYDDRPCHSTVRIPSLFYLTLEECDFSRRMAASVLFGGFIGYERRAADRPAGIRTMALVALGSCFFTISSQQAFRDSPMTWDSSRVTAAIPSGVGFLGAGLIWKGSLSDGMGGEVHQVHGITTAASVWLAAAVGVGAGGALYAVSAYSTALIILVLRFGPRLYLQNDRGFEDDDDDWDEDEDFDEEDDEIKPENDEKYGETRPGEKYSGSAVGESDHNDYEMHHRSFNQTPTMKNTDRKKYGATDIEQNTVAAILQQDQRRKVESINRVAADSSNGGPQPLSWLTNLLPGRENRQRPQNPYQEFTRDREVMRLMKKKKSMSKMTSRPSFCT